MVSAIFEPGRTGPSCGLPVLSSQNINDSGERLSIPWWGCTRADLRHRPQGARPAQSIPHHPAPCGQTPAPGTGRCLPLDRRLLEDLNQWDARGSRELEDFHQGPIGNRGGQCSRQSTNGLLESVNTCTELPREPTAIPMNSNRSSERRGLTPRLYPVLLALAALLALLLPGGVVAPGRTLLHRELVMSERVFDTGLDAFTKAARPASLRQVYQWEFASRERT